jgi:hypothetical protein
MSINGKKMKERQKSVELQSQTALDNQNASPGEIHLSWNRTLNL